MPRGYWMVNWFKTEFGDQEVRLAARQGGEPETRFEQLVAATLPGSDGLLLQPYWSPGLRVPGPEARGAIIGWRDTHTRAHLYRAILEGLAYALREGKERCEARSAVQVSELHVVGGGAQSDAALKITADIFGLPVVRPENYEASGLGAAIDAAVGLKLHSSFDAATQAMVRTSHTVEPDPRNRELYDDLSHSLYQPLYHRLQPLYEAMHGHRGLRPDGPSA